MTRVPTVLARDAAADRQWLPESDSHGEPVMDRSLSEGYVRYNVLAAPRMADGNSAVIFACNGVGGSNAGDRRTEQKKKRTVH